MKHFRTFISRCESLLVEERWPELGDGFAETTHGVFVTASDALHKMGDAAVRAIRFDRETLTGEDVTEDLASAYIAAHGNIEPECIVPPFVENSEAWERFCDDLTPDDGSHIREQEAVDAYRELAR